MSQSKPGTVDRDLQGSNESRPCRSLPYVPIWDRELVGAVGVVVVSGYGVIGIEQDAVNGARQKPQYAGINTQ